MQSHSGSRESTLGLVPGSRLSKPTSGDIVPSVRSQFLGLPDSSSSWVPSTCRLWGPSHSDHRKWNETNKVPRRKRLFLGGLSLLLSLLLVKQRVGMYPAGYTTEKELLQQGYECKEHTGSNCTVSKQEKIISP